VVHSDEMTEPIPSIRQDVHSDEMTEPIPGIRQDTPHAANCGVEVGPTVLFLSQATAEVDGLLARSAKGFAEARSVSRDDTHSDWDMQSQCSMAMSDGADQTDCSEVEDASQATKQVSKRRTSMIAVDCHVSIRDRYNLKGKSYVSSGAMGTLHKAVGKVTGALRVVKTLSKKPATMQKLNKQLTLLRTLDHPNIMMVQEVFEGPKYMHLVLDYCEGGTLSDRLRENKNNDTGQSEVQSAMIMRPVLRALNYMHEKCVCHRDVNPKNILFTHIRAEEALDSRLHIQLAGLHAPCKFKKGRDIVKSPWTRGQKQYVAPESLSGTFTKAIDIWSCGIVVHELLYGCLPPLIEEKTKIPMENPISPVPQKMTMNMVSAAQPPEGSNVSPDGHTLCEKMLRIDPKKRITCAQACVHVWVSKAAPKLRYPEMRIDVIEQLKSFRTLNRFKQAALRVLASILSEEETSEARKIFLSLDLDGDGMLSMEEFRMRIEADPALVRNYSGDAVENIFNERDDGKHLRKNFSYMEFLAATFDREKSLTEGQLRVTFDCFDLNNDGVLIISELAAGHFLGDTSMEELGTAVKDIDYNGDRVIDFEEFKRMMTM